MPSRPTKNSELTRGNWRLVGRLRCRALFRPAGYIFRSSPEAGICVPSHYQPILQASGHHFSSKSLVHYRLMREFLRLGLESCFTLLNGMRDIYPNVIRHKQILVLRGLVVQPSICRQGRAGGPTSVVGAQERYQRSNVINLANSSSRRSRFNQGLHILQKLLITLEPLV